MGPRRYGLPVLLLPSVVCVLLAACSSGGATISDHEMDVGGRRLYTPHQMRVAYGFDALLAQGFTGKGQTVVVIDSFGSPTLQQDMDTFDNYYHLPPTTVQVRTPLGAASNRSSMGSMYQTDLPNAPPHPGRSPSGRHRGVNRAIWARRG